jgi:hypothetical protein
VLRLLDNNTIEGPLGPKSAAGTKPTFRLNQRRECRFIAVGRK